MSTIHSTLEAFEFPSPSAPFVQALFIQAINTEGLRLSNPDDVRRMAKMSADAAEALMAELNRPAEEVAPEGVVADAAPPAGPDPSSAGELSPEAEADGVATERDALERQVAGLKAQLAEQERLELDTIKDRNDANDRIQSIHIALGGDGEWVGTRDLGAEAQQMAEELSAQRKAARSTEVESISKERTANLEQCKPEDRVDVGDRVVLGDGRTGTVVEEHRQFEVEVDGTKKVHYLNDDFVHAVGESASTTDVESISSDAGGDA